MYFVFESTLFYEFFFKSYFQQLESHAYMITIVLPIPIAKDKQYACAKEAMTGHMMHGYAKVIDQKTIYRKIKLDKHFLLNN